MRYMLYIRLFHINFIYKNIKEILKWNLQGLNVIDEIIPNHTHRFRSIFIGTDKHF